MNNTPPRKTFGTSSIVVRTKDAFILWHNILPHIPKTARFGTGARIESHFLYLLEYIYQAYYAKGIEKSSFLTKAILENDMVIFLLQTAQEAKLIPEKQYAHLADMLYEIGKMLGGWKKAITEYFFKTHILHLLYKKPNTAL